MTVVIRPCTAADLEEVRAVQIAAFTSAEPGSAAPEHLPPSTLERQRSRLRHLLTHDPEGAWVAVVDERIVGAALALRRGDLWGLSLLVVDPACQSRGTGSRLLAASLQYAEAARRAFILSTDDARAMRAYARAGFDLHPQVGAHGRSDPSRLPGGVERVRAGGPDDIEFADVVDDSVRRAPRGPDHALLAEQFTMFVVDDAGGRGYAYLRPDGEVVTVAATDDHTAAALLWRCLAATDERGQEAVVEHISANQQWAVKVAVAAGLTLRPAGPAYWRGGAPPRGYLPSGAYL